MEESEKTVYDISWTSKEKIAFFTSVKFNPIESQKEIIEIMKSENDFNVLEQLKNYLLNRSEFIKNANIELFLEAHNILDGIRANLVWGIIKLIPQFSKKERDKNLLIQYLDTKNSYLRYPTLCHLRRYDVISEEDWIILLKDQNVYFLDEIVMENTIDSINETIILINSLFPYKDGIFEEIFTVLREFSESYSMSENINSFLSKFLEEILVKLGFSRDNVLMDLFSDFHSIEAQLYTSLDDYRDHISHSFRVFLLGFQFLVVKWSTENHQNDIDLISWVFIAFFHDLGYGLAKINELSNIIESHSKDLVKILPASLSFLESSRIFAEKVIDLFDNMVTPSKYPYEEYRFLRIIPILKSWDEKEHGLMSAILFLQKVNDIIMDDYRMFQKYSEQWNNIFLRAALAMAIHTYPTQSVRGLDADMYDSKGDYRLNYPIFPSLLLILFDSFEYLDRPKFNSFEAPLDEIRKRDVVLDIKLSYGYSIHKFMFLEVKLNYKQMGSKSLFEVATDIQDKFLGFNSTRFGIKFILSDPDENKIEFDVLKCEEISFLEYLEIKNLELHDISDIFPIYCDFVISNLKNFNFNDSEKTKWTSKRISFQILSLHNRIKGGKKGY